MLCLISVCVCVVVKLASGVLLAIANMYLPPEISKCAYLYDDILATVLDS